MTENLKPAGTSMALIANGKDEISASVDRSLLDLRNWAEKRDYSGFEPFDILSSPLLQGRWARSWPLGIALIQFGKRFAGPRIRKCFRVPESKNPKAFGLFLSAYCDLARCGYDTWTAAAYLKSELKRLRSSNEPEYCWGYDWDHVSRGGRMPAFSPNSIATCFCAHALLDMAETFGDLEAWKMAQSCGRFLLARLNRPVDTSEFLCFSYTPLDRARVYNASVHTAGLLARLAPRDPEYVKTARRAMKYLVAQQLPNGAWYYGAARIHRWIDGFHTAYNLGSLLTYQRMTSDSTFAPSLRLGYDYYVSTFFRSDGAPKYFHNSVYPIDIHSCSQAIVTFCDFAGQDQQARNRAFDVARWTLQHMRHADGSFFFQAHRFWTNRTPYMRWGQAWMLHALARLKRTYLLRAEEQAESELLKPLAGPNPEQHAADAPASQAAQRNSC
jgi:hypothetical protein